MTYVIYDLEIIKGVCGRDEPLLDDIDYCDGWDDKANMGISVLGSLEFPIISDPPELGTFAPSTRVYLADNLRPDFIERIPREATLLIGYNNIRFDDQVIEATCPGWLQATAHIPRYDILQEIWKAEGHPIIDDQFDKEVHTGYGLDLMAKANGLPGKTGHGAHAPIDWQRGHHGKVISYCLEDVRLTTLLICLIDENGGLKAPEAKGGHFIPMSLPVQN